MSFVLLCGNTYSFKQDNHDSNSNIKPELFHLVEYFLPSIN